MTPRSRKILWLAVRIAVSALCITYVVWNVDFLDRVVLEVPEAENETLHGWIRSRTEDSVTLELTSGETRTQAISEVARDEATGTPIVAQGFLHVFHDVFHDGQWPWFVAAVLAYSLSPVFGAFRWRMLLRAQGLHLTVGQSWRLTAIGFFFNTFMLGVTGGDVVKGYYIVKRTERKAEAVTTVFLDRLVGTIGMALLCVAAVISRWNDPAIGEVRYLIFIFLGGMTLGGVILYSRRVRRRLRIDRLLARLPFRKMVRRLDTAVLIYRNHKRMIATGVLYSWGAHLVSIASVYFCARALGIETSPLYFLIYMPIVWIAAVFFPSIGALGVIEGLCQRYFSRDILNVGTQFEALALALAMALLFRAAMFFAVLPGGVLNVVHPDVSVREARREFERREDNDDA